MKKNLCLAITVAWTASAFFADGDLICMHVLYANFSVLGVGDCGSSWLSMKQYDIGFCMLKLNYCLLGIHKITKVKNDNDLHDPRKWKWNRPPSFFSTRLAKWTKKKKWSPKGINFRFRGVKGQSFSVRSTWLLLHFGIYLQWWLKEVTSLFGLGAPR